MKNETTEIRWQTILNALHRHKKTLVIAHIIALGAVICNVPIPLLMPLLVDEVLLQQPATLVHTMNSLFSPSWHGPTLYILIILLITLSLRLSGIGLSVWQTYYFSSISKEITYAIRSSLLDRLPLVSMTEYETLGSGQFASHLITDVNVIDDFISTTVSKLIIAVLSLLGIIAILLWMHWQLALFIIFLNPLVIYFTILMGKKVKELKRKENLSIEIFQQSLSETMLAIKQIRAYNRERHYVNRLVDHAFTIKTESIQFVKKSDAANRMSMGIFLLGFDSFRALGMLMVVFSDLSVGQMMAVFGYLWFMMSPVQEILNVQYSFFMAKAAIDRINQFINLKNEPVYETVTNPFVNKLTTSITMRDIEFSYYNKQILNGIDLKVEAGEKIALVGASGSGKTTLIHIILGLYPLQQGMLYFDGVPVTQIGLSTVRDNVATVLQHPALFNDSIRANICLGREFSDEEIFQSLEIAQLSELVQNAPHGLDSRIGLQGVRLSGGERQRLAIARMLLRKPKVVLFDEATSALDTETESELYKKMQTFLQPLTCIIIAHRLSAVQHADRILVLNEGKIAEQGSHDDLINLNGLYHRLYSESIGY